MRKNTGCEELKKKIRLVLSKRISKNVKYKRPGEVHPVNRLAYKRQKWWVERNVSLAPGISSSTGNQPKAIAELQARILKWRKLTLLKLIANY